MASVQVASAAAMRTEIVAMENEEVALQQELEVARREASEAHAAGAALLSAVEAATAPLMLELAAARRACGEADLTKAVAGAGGEQAAALRALLGDSAEALEADISHLQLDLGHYQELAERLHGEERGRAHELRRLRRELERAAEDLSYERLRHSSFAEFEVHGGRPSLKEARGRRQETESEAGLRQAAEQRAGRLAHDLSVLANDTTSQQATIEQLTKRLDKARKISTEHDQKLTKVCRATGVLQQRLTADPSGAEGGEGPPKGSLTKKKHASAASTSKLPHLSF